MSERTVRSCVWMKKFVENSNKSGNFNVGVSSLYLVDFQVLINNL